MFSPYRLVSNTVCVSFLTHFLYIGACLYCERSLFLVPALTTNYLSKIFFICVPKPQCDWQISSLVCVDCFILIFQSGSQLVFALLHRMRWNFETVFACCFYFLCSFISHLYNTYFKSIVAPSCCVLR